MMSPDSITVCIYTRYARHDASTHLKNAPQGDISPMTRPSTHAVLTRPGDGLHCLSDSVDIIGDVHGCLDELETLLELLGWERDGEDVWRHPEDRLLVFVGDLINRGPDSFGVLERFSAAAARGRAMTVLGNHDLLFVEALNLRPQRNPRWIEAVHELMQRFNDQEIQRQEKLRRLATAFAETAPLWISFGHDPVSPELVVVHACWRPDIEALTPEERLSICTYGPTNTPKPGARPLRLDWRPLHTASRPFCVFGHTAFLGDPCFEHNTLCLDTGCVFGGDLSAFRWPERQCVSVKAARAYADYPNIPNQPPLVPISKETNASIPNPDEF